MSDVVDGARLGGVPAEAGRGDEAAARGAFRGESVEHVRNPSAELADAAEELTFAQSETVERKLSQRKLKSHGHGANEAQELARRYLEEIPDLERDGKLEEFAASVAEAGGDLSADALRERARQFSADQTHQFSALAFAREQAAGQGANESLLAALDEAIGALEAEAGGAVRAGLNVSAVAAVFAGRGAGDVQELRDLYRAVVLDCEDIKAAYERVVADHPGEDFEPAVGFMLKALGADLAASAQSVSKPRLRQLVDDMYQLKSLNSVHEQCADLVRRVRRNFACELASTAPRDVLREVLSARDRAWQGADAFAGLPARIGVHGDQAGIYFLQGLKEVVRFVPQKAYGGDAAQRDRVMLALQEALDAAIDAEAYDD